MDVQQSVSPVPTWHSIQRRVEAGQSVYLKERGGDLPSVVSHGKWTARLFRWFRPQAYTRQMLELARIATDALDQCHRFIPLRDRMGVIRNHPAIEVGEALLKQYGQQLTSTERGQQLRDRLITAKTNATAEHIQRYPDFIRFLEKNHLHRYIWYHGDEVRNDPSTGEPMLKVDDAYLPWSRIQAQFTIAQSGKFSGTYRQTGLVAEGLLDWSELQPFTREDPKNWGHRYLFEYCSWAPKKVSLFNNHSWIRLKTPDGDVYSAGSFPHDKGAIGTRTRPMRMRKTELQSPDLSEYCKGDYYALQFEINESVFKQMKTQIEQDKREDRLTYHILSPNCTSYNNRIARIGGVAIPTATELAGMILPDSVTLIGRGIYRALPGFLKKVALTCWNLFFNTVGIVLGGTLVSDAIRNWRNVRILPHISHFSHMWRTLMIDHPYNLAWGTIRQEVDQWRQQRKQELQMQVKQLRQSGDDGGDRVQALVKEMKALPYRLPPHYLVSA